jgi:hypothetical protein
MAGCSSGRLSYVVVSEGGIAGVGETLRRLPWSQVHVEKDELVTKLSTDRFAALETVKRDEWPSR